MRAIGFISQPKVGESEKKITELEVPIPKVKKGQVLVKVKSSSINIDDLHIYEGTMLGGLPITPKMSIEKPAIPGTDVAGIIEAIGPDVPDFKVGQEVYGVCAPNGQGSWAEYVILQKNKVCPLPENWHFNEGAAAALAGMVVASTLEKAGNVNGKKVVVIGASGGLGSLCVQALVNLNVELWGVCSGKNADMVKKLGAQHIIDYSQSTLSQVFHFKEVDLVFDFVGGKAYESEAMRIVKANGKFITVTGPEKFVGEVKTGLWGVIKLFSYIAFRTIFSKMKGPQYYLVAPHALNCETMKKYFNNVKPVIDQAIGFNPKDISTGIGYVKSHRAKGKVIIQM